MSCYSPLPAERSGILNKNGKFDVTVFPRNEVNLLKFGLRMPCGKCIGCRLKRSREWAIRCVHEAALHEVEVGGRGNCFITLTYAPDSLKSNSLIKSDFQDFMKRLRKHFVPKCPFPVGHPDRPEWFFRNGVRFYMAGEYGEKSLRPHFHSLLFNLSFDDKYFWQNSPSGEPIFRSPTLEKLWTFGYSSIGSCTFESAGYVARYVMKKMYGDVALSHYADVDLDTGEVLSDRLPEYNDMSRKPGIAKFWYDKFGKHCVQSDGVIVGAGKRFPTPKYYESQYELLYPEELSNIKEKRAIAMKAFALDSTPERLAVREIVKSRQVDRLVRKIDFKDC